MSDLIEAMEAIAEALREEPLNDFSYAARLNVASIALAALRETHHLAPKEEITDWRRREVQAIGAAISTRNWHTLETSYNSLRDKMDRRLALYALEKRHD